MTRMGLVVLTLLITLFQVAQAQVIYVPVDKTDAVTFTIRHFGIAVKGNFSDLTGEIIFDPGHPENGKFRVSVAASSVDTGIDLRDKHLRKSDFFDVEKYDAITIISNGIVRSSKPGTWILKAKLTMKGVTHPIEIPFLYKQISSSQLEFVGEFTINRREFGVGGRPLGMSDDVTVKLSVVCQSKPDRT